MSTKKSKCHLGENKREQIPGRYGSIAVVNYDVSVNVRIGVNANVNFNANANGNVNANINANIKVNFYCQCQV